MISRISGTIAFANDRFAVIDTGSVGYKVFATAETLRRAGKSEETSLWTHLAVRENALDLYGFLDRAELEFFELLLTVSGIGPKTALGIMNIAPMETIFTAVSRGDAGYLTKTTGVGNKNAQKIVLELKGKMDGFSYTEESGCSEETDAQDALQALGYSQKEAREALKKVSKEIATPSEKVREALKILGK
jgi:Holliday junction DNA helicase RuvA